MTKYIWLLVFVFIPAIGVSDAATNNETTTSNDDLTKIKNTAQNEAPSWIKDTSGTNPLLILRSISASHEYQRLATSKYSTRFIYNEPTKTGSGNLSISFLRLSNLFLPDYNINLSDIGIKYSYATYLGDKRGMLVSTELIIPVGRGFIPGSGTWSVKPGFSYVIYLTPQVIINPSYNQQFSFTGGSGKDKINFGTYALYVAYVDTSKRWWLTSDLSVYNDYANNQHASSLWKFSCGHVLGFAYGGTINGYIQPGIGMGPDRSYDWSLKAGISIVGF